MNVTQVRSVFAYGTLKQGQCRSDLWPTEPHSVKPAWVTASLFGRDDYPALTSGDDKVLGEIWRFVPSQIPMVIEALDAIEGCNQLDASGRDRLPDLYKRVVVEATCVETGEVSPAFTYFYACDLAEDGFTRLESGADGFAQWAGQSAYRSRIA